MSDGGGGGGAGGGGVGTIMSDATTPLGGGDTGGTLGTPIAPPSHTTMPGPIQVGPHITMPGPGPAAGHITEPGPGQSDPGALLGSVTPSQGVDPGVAALAKTLTATKLGGIGGYPTPAAGDPNAQSKGGGYGPSVF